jgi:hypothetical protein
MHALKRATLLFGIVVCALAVRRAEALWGVGPLGGANMANADVDGHDTHSIAGWAFGARLEMGMNPILGLMFDPMLIQNGAKFDASGNAVPGRGKFVNLELPVLLNARLNLGSLGVYGFLGPDLVLNTDAQGNVVSENDLRHTDMSPMGLAGQIGAGLAMGVAPFIDVTADARYSHGFTDMLDGAKGDIQNWRTRDVRLNLGVLLHTPHWSSLMRSGNAFQSH